MPEFVTSYWFLPFVLAVLAVAVVAFLMFEIVNHQKEKTEHAYRIKVQKETILELEAKIEKMVKALADSKKSPVPSKELVEFMQDLKIHGYGVARIDPDQVFYRGSNR